MHTRSKAAWQCEKRSSKRPVEGSLTSCSFSRESSQSVSAFSHRLFDSKVLAVWGGVKEGVQARATRPLETRPSSRHRQTDLYIRIEALSQLNSKAELLDVRLSDSLWQVVHKHSTDQSAEGKDAIIKNAPPLMESLPLRQETFATPVWANDNNRHYRASDASECFQPLLAY
ncbi:MAG: hypothetical protein FRX49_06775 [Trebouxia sp. A1-2]|nr:MAG: hypothetical protein FRX49_06775 [Trebouxia sp. A1-2]